MNPLWIVAIVFLLAIGGAIAFAWILETSANRLGTIVVIGSRSLYKSEPELMAFFGERFEFVDRARGRVLLMDGAQAVVLKRGEIERMLSAEELAAVAYWRGKGKTICVLRKNDLADRAAATVQQMDAVAAYYREHPELTTSFERSDKSTFVPGI